MSEPAPSMARERELVPSSRASMEPFASRRQALLRSMRDGVAVFPSMPVALRNNDVEHPFRQDSDLHYLSNLDEPDSLAVISSAVDPKKGPAKPASFSLFVRPRNPDRERWDGARIGVDGAVRDLGADAAFTIDELSSKLPDLFFGHTRLHYKLGKNRALDDKVLKAIDVCRGRARNGGTWPVEIVDPAVTLHELRLKKQPDEIELMQRAADIARDGHLAAMRSARSGMYEFEIEAAIEGAFRRGGSDRVAYSSIVAGGRNATVLHYRSNDAPLRDGQLLLIDAGCEYRYYASDVTRTFPVSGRFTPEQRAVYQVVLDAQLAAIGAAVPGSTLDRIHEVAVTQITAGLVRLGLLKGDVESNVRDAKYRRFYMHRTSHWLGMDVHDVGGYCVGMTPRPLEPGMVVTVEPGLYLGSEDDIPEALRDTGIRIEDDVLITELGPRVLTDGIPKTIEDIERACAR